MSNSIAKDFKLVSLIRFAFPTMIMMMFMSLYTIIDGIFVSRLVGTSALSALNIAFPPICLVIAVGVMYASGGSAIIARKLGEKKVEEAQRDFSTLIYVGLLIGIVFLLIGFLFAKPLSLLLGATELLLEDCIDYLRISLYFAPACILQLMFQNFFVTAGKPNFGLLLTIAGGFANIILDYVFMGPLQMGISGAAIATGIGQLIPACIGLLYFAFVRTGSLYLVKPHFYMALLTESSSNGASEMVTNLSNAIVTYLFNIVMLKYLGEPGVAAITIILYGQFLFNALYMGYSMGVAPVISFNHGRKNYPLLKRIFKICIGFISLSSLGVTILALLTAPTIVGIFTPRSTITYEITKTGFLLFSINYIFAGLNIFASSMFTAFSNGKISAIISFVRTFILIVINILFLPVFLGVTGVWLAIPVAEFLTMFLSGYYFIKMRQTYHYL